MKPIIKLREINSSEAIYIYILMNKQANIMYETIVVNVGVIM